MALLVPRTFLAISVVGAPQGQSSGAADGHEKGGISVNVYSEVIGVAEHHNALGIVSRRAPCCPPAAAAGAAASKGIAI
jgi:hypothetical protein